MHGDDRVDAAAPAPADDDLLVVEAYECACGGVFCHER
jgi:hypothetical protein